MADDRERKTERTIVTSDGERGGSGAVIAILVLLVVVLLAVLFFSGVFNRDDQQDLNVEVNTPDVNVIVPPTQLPPLTPMPEGQSPPDVNVNVTTPPPAPTDNLGNTANTATNSG
jgi:hypothetical protein